MKGFLFCGCKQDWERNSKPDSKKKPLIICICEKNNETQFYQLLTKQHDRIEYRSFQEYFGKKNAKFSVIGMKYGHFTHTFLTRDESNIIVFNKYFGYNVYDIRSDRWLLETNNKEIDYQTRSARSLLVNDEILIISERKQIHLYNLSNIINPHAIEHWRIQSKIYNDYTRDYNEHGVCLLEFYKNPIDDNDNEIIIDKNNINNYTNHENGKEIYYIKILLFGGAYVMPFERSIIEFKIKLWKTTTTSYYNSKVNHFEKTEILEKPLKKHIKYLGSMRDIKDDLYDFAYQCIVNYNNHRIIVIIGDIDVIEDSCNSIFLYNYDTNEMWQKRNALPTSSRNSPVTIIETRKEFDKYLQSLKESTIVKNLNVPNQILSLIMAYFNKFCHVFLFIFCLFLYFVLTLYTAVSVMFFCEIIIVLSVT